MESYPGGRKVDVFIPNHRECDKDIIVKEIERSCQRKEERELLVDKQIPNLVAQQEKSVTSRISRILLMNVAPLPLFIR